MKKGILHIWCFFFISLFVVIGIWGSVRDVTLAWHNVPPVPSYSGAKASFLGDEQASYRFLGLMFQFFGNTSGHSVALSDYDYTALDSWFHLLDKLDSKAEFLPFLVSYYFSASQNAEHVKPVTKFLEKVGVREGRQKWRWLSQAVYLARYKLKDTEYALQLAKKLNEHKDADVGAWARNMQSIILSKAGEQEAALAMALALLKDQAASMDPKEVVYLTHYICSELIPQSDIEKFAMCKDM